MRRAFRNRDMSLSPGVMADVDDHAALLHLKIDFGYLPGRLESEKEGK